MMLEAKMKVFIVLCWMYMLPFGVNAQIVTVNCDSSVVPDLSAKITTNSVILNRPVCCFKNVSSSTCTPDICQIWLVPALDSAVVTFDADKTSPDLLSLSPYPNAFTSSGGKNYFLTKVGVQNDVSCSSPPGYFMVGADGQCTTTNCNGVLPAGSTMRFKYLLINPASQAVLAETNWSDKIALYTAKDPGTIDDSLPGRSAAMIVITAILSTAMAVLLLFLLVILCLTCCGGKGTTVSSVVGSFRIPHYDTHSLRDPSPYENPAYEREKKYASAPTLPRSTPVTSVVHDDQQAIKMQKI